MAVAGVFGIGAAVFAACGTPVEDGTSSVVTHTVTQTVDDSSATQTAHSDATGEYTPPIDTGTTVPVSTTPPLVSTPTETTISTPSVTTGTIPSEPDPALPTVTTQP